MKFYTYIHENKEISDLINKDKNELALPKIIDLLEKDCKPFLNEWKKSNIKDFLYTGRTDYNAFLKRPIRKNRLPLNTPKEIHHIIDKWLFKNFGVKGRSNAMFCSTDIDLISGFGYEHFVFPIGNYKLISSENVNDLYIEFGRKVNMSLYSFLNRNTFQEVEDEVWDFLKKAKYKEGLPKHGNEIMLVCKEVYLIGWSNYFEKEFLKYFK